ncbi:MAG TPA: hypothetical protein VK273_05205 [Gaiellaceae bacterium]|nr:hypothetical protein [Gaiellaceae bacterium]
MPVNDCRSHVDELPVRRARVLAELESDRLVHRVAFHENALRSLRDRSAAEGAFEVVVLGEASQHDVDLPLLKLAVLPARLLQKSPATLAAGGEIHALD